MAVRLTPRPEEPIATKPVRMPDWDTEGAYEEHIDILDFLRPEVFRAAQDAARKTITGRNGQSREDIDQDVFLRALFDAQVKGWRLFDPSLAPIPFTPEHVHALPWDVKAWLNEEILSCGGSIPTRTLRIPVGSKEYDFRGAPEGLGAAPLPAVPDPE